MKKKILLLIIFLLVVATGCFEKSTLKTEERPSEEQKKVLKITSQELDTMKKVSELAFIVSKESMSVDEYTEEEKSSIATRIPEKGYLDVTGTEMEAMFKEYFGKNQTVTFSDIDCFLKHQTEEEQVLYFFDDIQDKYIYNEKHPGHGGGGNPHIAVKLEFDSVESNSEFIAYNVKAMFYGPVLCRDVGPCDHGKAYKSYADAKDEKNELIDIDNSKYTVENQESGLPITDLDQLFSDYRDKLDVYTFKFIKEDNHLVFSSYKKA